MKAALRDILETVILTALIFLVVQSVVKNFRVEGTSMEPTLHDNEFLLVDKAVYWSVSSDLVRRFFPSIQPAAGTDRVYLFHPPRRGDIVVFLYPHDRSRDFIKRVIGLPGDVVEVRDGKVFVNGQALVEPYIMSPPRYTMPPMRVPENQYFVLGDNRNDSSDSHVWGTVPWYDIVGQAWVSYWPLGDWQFFPSGAMAAP
ncbi:MAG: signal peptidase I [Chloroflexi bacterium]|nr:signal peptidase I [Chloroflexota bacterium]